MSKLIEKYEGLIERANQKVWDLQDKIEGYEDKLAKAQGKCAEYQAEQKRIEEACRERQRQQDQKDLRIALGKAQQEQWVRDNFKPIADVEDWEQFLPQRA